MVSMPLLTFVLVLLGAVGVGLIVGILIHATLGPVKHVHYVRDEGVRKAVVRLRKQMHTLEATPQNGTRKPPVPEMPRR